MRSNQGKAHGGGGQARKKRYEELLAAASDSAARQASMTQGSIVLPPPPRLGANVLKAQGLAKSLPPTDGEQQATGGGRVLFEGLSLDIEPGAIVGVVGRNGCGKSSLFSILAGLDEPDEGSVVLGDTVSLGLVSQSRLGLDPNKSAFEEIGEGEDVLRFGDPSDGGDLVPVRQYIAGFG